MTMTADGAFPEQDDFRLVPIFGDFDLRYIALSLTLLLLGSDFIAQMATGSVNLLD